MLDFALFFLGALSQSLSQFFFPLRAHKIKNEPFPLSSLDISHDFSYSIPPPLYFFPFSTFFLPQPTFFQTSPTFFMVLNSTYSFTHFYLCTPSLYLIVSFYIPLSFHLLPLFSSSLPPPWLRPSLFYLVTVQLIMKCLVFLLRNQMQLFR